MAQVGGAAGAPPPSRVRPVSASLALLLVLSACTNATPPPESSPSPGVRVVGVRPVRQLSFGAGLVLDVPADWIVVGAGLVNRATQRELMAGNGALDALPTIPGNGDIDPAALPSGRVVLSVQSFCRMSCLGPDNETALPLDWTDARPLLPGRILPAGKHELALAFRWFDQPLHLVARWSDDAPPRDIAAISAIARSVRAERALPQRGEFHSWLAVGPSGALDVGAVRRETVPAGAPVPMTGESAPFFLVRGRQNLFAFSARPVVDPECQVSYDAASDRLRCSVEGRSYEWTRFGRYQGSLLQRDLPQHSVFVRDGTIFVRYSRTTLLEPSVRVEADER